MKIFEYDDGELGEWNFIHDSSFFFLFKTDDDAVGEMVVVVIVVVIVVVVIRIIFVWGWGKIEMNMIVFTALYMEPIETPSLKTKSNPRVVDVRSDTLRTFLNA